MQILVRTNNEPTKALNARGIETYPFIFLISNPISTVHHVRPKDITIAWPQIPPSLE